MSEHPDLPNPGSCPLSTEGTVTVMNSAYSYSQPDAADLTEFDEDLYVVSCGCKEYTNSDHRIDRPNGRDDYHVLYLAQGSALYQMGGEMRRVEAGHAVVYKPMEPHAYIYRKEDRPAVYWIHFRGRIAGLFMEQLGLTGSSVYNVGQSTSLCSSFLNIIKELQIKDTLYFKMCRGYLVQLLTLLARHASVSSKRKIFGYKDLVNVVYLINEHCEENTAVEEYARLCHLSKYRFITNFKALTGFTPIEYRNNIRIQNAQMLLESREHTISEIAEQLGFHSASYFSTVFKQHTGQSPNTYKRMMNL